MPIPIGDPRPAGTPGPAGDQRPPGSTDPAGDPRPASPASPATDTTFDPAQHTVTEVNTHIDSADPTERDRIITAETDGKARAGILR